MTYTKSLRPFLKLFLPKYIHREYPKYVELCDKILQYLEETNNLKWYVGDTTNQKLNSIYHNIENFDKHFIIDDLPVENISVLNAYLNDFASDIDYRNTVLDFNSEDMRQIAKYANVIYNLKDSWKAYNFIFALIHAPIISGATISLSFDAFYKADSTFLDETPPDYFYRLEVADSTNINYGDVLVGSSSSASGTVKYIDSDNDIIYLDRVENTFSAAETLTFNATAITTISTILTSDYLDDDKIILTEIPVYSIESNGINGLQLDRADVTIDDKGTHPFEYQIIGKNDILSTGTFVSDLRKSMHPAGFDADIFYVLDDIEILSTEDSKIFPKQIFTLECVSTGYDLLKNDGINIITNDNYHIIVTEEVFPTGL